jgi:hypothetical protein
MGMERSKIWWCGCGVERGVEGSVDVVEGIIEGG